MVQLNENTVKKIKKLVGYNGRKVRVEEFKPMSINSYWDSGCRDYFYFVKPNTSAVTPVRQNGTMFDGLNLRAEKLESDEVLVEVNIVAGKYVGCRIYFAE